MATIATARGDEGVGFMQRAPRFAHPSPMALYEYWNAKRGGRAAPERSEIEPGDIRAILPDTFILDVDAPGPVTWRLAGTRVAAIHCRDLKDRPFLGDWQGEGRDGIASLITAVVREAAVAVVQFEGRSRRDATLDFEMVMMPVDVFGRSGRRVLGAVVPLDVPYWLGTEPPARRRITAMRLAWPNAPDVPFGRRASVPAAGPSPEAAVPAQAPVWLPRAEPPALATARIGGRRVGHLMVLDGGRR